MTTTTISTALGGTLHRTPDGWQWSDGTPEPRVRDLALADVAPNFRCATFGDGAYIEIPRRWRDARYWPGGRLDDEAVAAIAALLDEGGVRAPIFCEGLAEALDDHRLTADGYRVPAALWDAAMLEPCGCSWDRAHEAEILGKAEAIRTGWSATGPAPAADRGGAQPSSPP